MDSQETLTRSPEQGQADILLPPGPGDSWEPSGTCHCSFVEDCEMQGPGLLSPLCLSLDAFQNNSVLRSTDIRWVDESEAIWDPDNRCLLGDLPTAELTLNYHAL